MPDQRFRLIADAQFSAKDQQQAYINLAAHFLSLADVHFESEADSPINIVPIEFEGSITLEPIE